jgi:hypothetical protein
MLLSHENSAHELTGTACRSINALQEFQSLKTIKHFEPQEMYWMIEKLSSKGLRLSEQSRARGLLLEYGSGTPIARWI